MSTKIVNGAMVTEIPVDTSKTNDQLERESHDYTLKGVKTFRGRDGHGLNATLLRGKKAVAFIIDEGCGGMVNFQWNDRMHGESAEEDLFKAFIATLPPDPDHKDSTLDPLTIQQFAMEEWVNTEVNRMLNDKKFRKLCKTNIVFQVGAKVGSEEFHSVKGLDLRAHIEQKYKGQKLRILNDEFKD